MPRTRQLRHLNNVYEALVDVRVGGRSGKTARDNIKKFLLKVIQEINKEKKLVSEILD